MWKQWMSYSSWGKFRHDGDDEGIDDGHAAGGPDGPLAAEAKPVQLMNMICWRLFDKAQTIKDINE